MIVKIVDNIAVLFIVLLIYFFITPLLLLVTSIRNSKTPLDLKFRIPHSKSLYGIYRLGLPVQEFLLLMLLRSMLTLLLSHRYEQC